MATSTDAAARTLAADGREVGTVDRQTGIVTSKWTMVGQPTANGVFVSRFTVIVAPAASGTNITVRMDVQSCPAGAYSVGDVEVKPTCRPIDGVFPGDQAKIDALGAKLKAAVEPKPG